MGELRPTSRLEDGRFAACEILEITALPRWELLGSTVAETAVAVDSLFARLVHDIHRRDSSGGLSVELLFATVPAKNQTYCAQTRLFFVLRGVDGDRSALSTRLASVIRSVESLLKANEFSAERLLSESQLASLEGVLAGVSTESVAAIARQERIAGGQAGISLYYNDVVTPSVGENVSVIINALSQSPNAAISLQLIPTSYTQEEQAGVARRRSYVDAARAQILRTPGGVVPSSFSDAAVSYVDFVNTQNDSVFYYNFLVFASTSEVGTLTGKVIDVLQADLQAGSTALTVVDVSDAGLSLLEGFATSPWANSNKLVYETREAAFWEAPGAPVDLIRLRYLAPSAVLRAAFKAPFDDRRIIGFESRRALSNKEKLHESVLSRDSFRVGGIIDAGAGGDTSVQAGVPLNDFCRHALVVGASGYGKTNFALGMLLRFWTEFDIPFLAIEPTKTEYRSLLDAIPGICVFTPGRNDVSPFIINPFVPPPGVTVESYVPSLMTAFGAAFHMPDPLPSIFRAAVNDCYTRYGWKSTSTVSDRYAKRFGLYEFIRVFKERVRRLDYQGETKGNIESAGVVRLTSLIEQNPNIYDTVNTIPLGELLAQPTVVELNAISDKEQKSLLMALLLASLCAYTKNNVPLGSRLSHIFMIDEAHVLLGNPSGENEDAGARSKTIEALEDMIAEVRAYGTGIVIADQSPSNVGRNVIANTDVKVMFRLVEQQNRDMISGATNMESSQEAQLAQLGVGECLLHFGRLNAPLHVKADNLQEIAPMAQSVDNSRIRDEVHFWDSHTDLLIPYRECSLNSCCGGGCDFGTRVDADFLASRIVSFYLEYVPDWPKLQAFLLTKAAQAVASCAETTPGVASTQRLRGCTMIKIVRKLLLEKSIGVSDAQIEGVLRDNRVMGSEAGAMAKGPERKSHG